MKLLLIGGMQAGEVEDELRIELGAGEIAELFDGALARHGRAIDLGGGHRVEGIDDGEHARAEREILPVAIDADAAAVVPGGRMADDVEHVGRGAAAFQDAEAQRAMALHLSIALRWRVRRA